MTNFGLHMPGRLSVGILCQANNKGGAQKLIAISALDLARNGHTVTIFIPVLPYYFYFVSLYKRPLLWVRIALRYLRDWARSRQFSFQELLQEEGARDRISVKFVPLRASRSQLERLDCLVLHSIAGVAEYQRQFPQERQIYLLHHPEEHDHGHADTFKRIRQSFRGKILVISPFTAREISDHVPNPPVLPDPVSPILWDQRHAFDPEAPRKDIFFWKDQRGGSEGIEIIRALLEVRPRTTVTIWCRGRIHKSMTRQALPGVDIVDNLSERELCDLYLGHSLLLFPSTYEGFGMPPIEALACGCIPILHPDVGAAELYARDGENSIYLNGNSRDIALRIGSTLDSPETLRPMRVAAPESIVVFDPNGYGQRLLEAAGFL